MSINVKCLNPIASVGLDQFGADYAMTEDYNAAEAVLVRSASMHEMELHDDLLAVARAGAGVNNIPLDACAEKGIVVFNTPGANANGVKELVIAGMLLASRDIVGGIDWVKENKADEAINKSVEKAKKAFAGSEIKGKKLGVIGLGAIGVLVANAAKSLGMEVYGCDPYLSVQHALGLSRSIHIVKTNEEIFANCDFITVHVPLLDSTKGMFNKAAFDLMDGTVLLNFSRDTLVNDEDMKEALASGKVKKYVTDFPNAKTANMDGVIAIPHLGASTAESEDNCAVMAVKELKAFIEEGNIINSVNYPNCDAGAPNEAGRITICHKNIPNMLSQFTGVFSSEGINIENMVTKSKGDFAYSVVDTTTPATADLAAKVSSIDGVLKVRVVK